MKITFLARDYPLKCIKCGFIFNQRAGVKWHMEKKHDIHDDATPFLTPVYENPENSTETPETTPENEPESDIIKADIAQKSPVAINPNLKNENLGTEFKEILEVLAFKKQLAKEKYIISVYNKMSRDSDNDIEPFQPQEIDINALKQEIKADLTPEPQIMPAEKQEPSANDLTALLIQLIAPHIPNIIKSLTAPAAPTGFNTL